MKILFFDTETTGLPKNYQAPISDGDNWPRLVQIAWIIHDTESGESKTYEAIIRPEGFEIPAESSAVHGITTEIAKDEGYHLNGLLSDIRSDIKKCDLIVGHNISFDMRILGAELFRVDMYGASMNKPNICTMRASTNYCKILESAGLSGRSEELHKHLFGVEFDGAHDAKADIEATAKCYFKLVELGVIKEEVGKC